MILTHHSDDIICTPAMNQIGDIQNPRGNITVLGGSIAVFPTLVNECLPDHTFTFAYFLF